MARKKEGEEIINYAIPAKLKRDFVRVAKLRFGLISRGIVRALEDFVLRYTKKAPRQ